jgi:hypothetical protein
MQQQPIQLDSACGQSQRSRDRDSQHRLQAGDREPTVRRRATAAEFTLPAKGEADFDVNVTANLNAALIALAGSLGHHTVGYRVYGEVHLKGSFLHSIPFDQKGRVKL